MKPKLLLGRDGLASDETGVTYYTADPYVFRECWGKVSAIMPAQAIAELEASLQASPDPAMDPSGIEESRQAAIKHTIVNIRKHYGIKEETK